ncbi:MAG: LPS export ABC transporter periplasmic protein LptC [Spirochaetales bacterium]|uniref:LPS export ABC transporter periplasmic protein LptC n=1 Tax=Candidatus Thalassospirochaeta sargassi TaxID=3119039 RepID=A0AAJ1IES4_9SPIO|nr:LPS export ABC transporter periplasmic protein LptC [Spirochaetales bacterium]
MLKKELFLTAAIFILMLSLNGCRFDYEESIMAENLSEEVPDTILKNFSQIMVKDSVPTFYIEAEESLSFGKRKETVFSNVHFQEFDSEGKVITDGHADNAKMFNETESVELWGGLNFYSDRERASLEGEYLFWDNELSTLSGKPDDRISIVEEDGSEIAGKGFFADSKTKTIKFSSQVSGSWKDE